MINKFKLFLFTIASALTLLVPAVVSPIAAHAIVTTNNINTDLCTGANLTFTQQSNCNGTGAETTVNKLIKLIINIFSIVVGIIAVIMIIIGGVKYILSGGASEQVSGAKNTILFAIVGLIVVALAQILVRYVLSRVSSTIQ